MHGLWELSLHLLNFRYVDFVMVSVLACAMYDMLICDEGVLPTYRSLYLVDRLL